jgi:tRNA A37 threonylcarbamoyladenosine biosynthesis protein TsaE
MLPLSDILAYSIPAEPLLLRIGDAPVEVAGLSADLRSRLADLMSPFVMTATELSSEAIAVRMHIARRPETPWWTITSGGRAPHHCFAPDPLLRYIEWLATAQALSRTTSLVVFHAAVLVRNSVALLLVGQSGAGKTTVTTGLIQRGWLPLTDDIALISPASLRVAPFPRCFHVDSFAASTIKEPALFEEAGALAGYLRPVRWADDAVRVGCIVELARNLEAPTSAQLITQAEAAGALYGSAIRAGQPQREAARIAVAVATGAQSRWRVNNGGLHDTLDLLERLANRSYPA